MNYTELQAAILSDTHRADFAGAVVIRFIEQGEALIRSLLNVYALEDVLTDAQRVDATSVYNLPTRVSHVRHIFYNDLPLHQTDESTVANYRTSAQVSVYAVRLNTVIFAGNPPPESEMPIHYFGMPDALSITPSNTLLTDYPQLYIDAASVYIYRRIHNYEAAGDCLNNVTNLCAEINRKVKKKLGGAQAVPTYNVSCRSSY